MNEELIKNLEEVLDIDNEEYKEQAKLAVIDFMDYCKPGGVNNWQHPEKPPIQTGLAMVCKKFKPARILDFGTGLTGLTFRKYAPDAESILVESSMSWLMKLRRHLEKNELKTDNLWWFDDLSFKSLAKLVPTDFQDHLCEYPILIPMPLKRTDDGSGDIVHVTAPLYTEPMKGYVVKNTTQWSPPALTDIDLLDRVSTSTIQAYIDNRDDDDVKLLLCRDPESKTPEQLGKFNFIHYDFGGMYIRTAYLRLAIDLLDRTKDSLIYIDDLHKKETILEGKKYEELVKEIIENRGGVWLNCGLALTDFQGGRGGIVYFPPIKDE